jgi:hypothetical protein
VSSTHRSRVNAALRRADGAVLVLAGPGGDDAAAYAARNLVGAASGLVDSISGLRSAGAPDPAIAAQYRALAESVAARLAEVGAALAGGKPPTAPSSDTTKATLLEACSRARQGAVAGEVNYSRVAAIGHLKQRVLAVDAAVGRVAAQASELMERPNVRLSGVHSPGPRFVASDLRSAMRLNSTAYRHALRATAVTSILFAVVTLAHLDHGEWAALAALRVLRPQYGPTTQRAWQRVVGNVVGGTCAAVAIAWIQSPMALAALVFVVVSAGFALRPVNYAFWVVFGTPLILLIGDIADPGDWHAAVGRIVMTIVGTAAAVIGYFLLLPEWDLDRLPGHLSRAKLKTADYLDVALAHVAEPSDENRAVLDAERRAATSKVGVVTESLAHASREPGAVEIRSTAAAVDDLAAIVDRLAALTSLPDVRSSPIPNLADYRQHAVAALRGHDALVDVVALDTAVEEMRRYVLDLHQRREVEMREQPDGETSLRAEVRENEPVIEELAEIAERIGSLTHAVAAGSAH